MNTTFSPEEYLKVKHPLRFRADGKFRVLFLGDPHGGYGRHPQIKPALETVVAAAKPDLVLFPGDLSGCYIGVHNEAELREYLDDLMEYLEVHHIPWAHVYGNHDSNLGLPNEIQQGIYESYEYCVSKRGSAGVHGVSNYVLPILPYAGEEPVLNIWALDSHESLGEFCRTFGVTGNPGLPNHFGQGGGSGNAWFSQVRWYMDTSEAIEACYGRKIPAILYQHIPLPEYALIPLNPYECQMDGILGDEICSSALNFGLFAACLERGDVKGIFCGHEHMNDFTGTYCGVKLCYCGGINYDCGCRDHVRGGRIVDFFQDDPGRFETKMLHLQELIGDAGNRRERWEFGLKEEREYK